MTTLRLDLGSSWKLGILTSVSILALMNIARATSRSDIAGYTLSLKEKEFTDMSMATSSIFDLSGKDNIANPSKMLYRQTNNFTSQVIRTREFSSKVKDDTCSISQVTLTQDQGSFMPDGTPVFHVTIINNCVRCSMQNIHITCGNWASETLVDPSLFRKFDSNECIVKNGSPMGPLSMLYFEYASSSMYPLSVNFGAACLCS